MNKNLRNGQVGRKIVELLEHHIVMHGYELARLCGCCANTVYKNIERLRAANIGIHSTHNGYMLSSKATDKDDYAYMLRLTRRRARDHIAAAAATPHIEKRWAAIKHAAVKSILGPIVTIPGDYSQRLLPFLAYLKEKDRVSASE